MVVLVLYGSSVSVWSPMASTTSLAASAEPEAASAARPSSADAQRMEKEDCFMEELQSVRGKNAGGLGVKTGSGIKKPPRGHPAPRSGPARPAPAAARRARRPRRGSG